MGNTVIVDVEKLDAEVRKQVLAIVRTWIATGFALIGLGSAGAVWGLVTQIRTDAVAKVDQLVQEKLKAAFEADEVLASLHANRMKIAENLLSEISKTAQLEGKLENLRDRIEESIKKADRRVLAAKQLEENSAGIHVENVAALLQFLKENDYQKTLLSRQVTLENVVLDAITRVEKVEKGVMDIQIRQILKPSKSD